MSSFLSGAGKVLGNIGGAFIGDPMLGNQLFGAAAGSGNQGGTNINKDTQKQSQYSNQGTMTPTEPGYATDFRKETMANTQNAINQAQAPVYGDAQKASYLNSLNDLANSSMDSLKQNLSRSGALTSGRLSQGVSDIDSARNSQAAGFFSQIPFLNAQARTATLNPLLATQAGLAGKAPTGYTQSQTGTGTDTEQSQSQQVNQGAPFLSNLAANLAKGNPFNPFGTNTLANLPYGGGVNLSSVPAPNDPWSGGGGYGWDQGGG